MALISPKNFMTPFTNKVHLATIAFVVILFAAFRAMGGAFSVERTVSNPSSLGAKDLYGRDKSRQLDADQDLLNYDSQDEDEVSGAVRSASPAPSRAPQQPANDLDEIIRKLNSR